MLSEVFPAGRPVYFHATSMHYAGEDCDILIQFISLQQMRICHKTYTVRKPTAIYTRLNTELLKAYIALQNNFMLTFGRSDYTALDTGAFNLSYIPSIENKLYFPSPGAYTVFSIHLANGLLQHLSGEFPRITHILNKYDAHEADVASLFDLPCFVTPEMEFLAYKILRHLQTEKAKRSYAEILCLELVNLILQRSERNAASPGRHLRHTAALQQVRQMIVAEASSSDSETLYDTEIQLADKAGLSLYQLKTGFKALFGIPPYQLLCELRLYRARKLILETGLSLLDIALMTGYKSREGLCKAYKRFFGYAPSRERAS